MRASGTAHTVSHPMSKDKGKPLALAMGWLTGMVEGEEKTIEVSENIWNTYDVGDSVPATINRLGIVSLNVSETD